MTAPKIALPPLTRTLSARLLVLTILVVMFAELFVYAPSIGRFRLVYLEERLAAAHIASLALEATPDNMIDEALENELLDHAGAYVVVLMSPKQGRKLMLQRKMPPTVDANFDLPGGGFFELIMQAFEVLMQTENRILRIRGPSLKSPDTVVEIVLDETPMRLAMYDYSKRILALSIVISMVTASMVFLSLHWLFVVPMRRITQRMIAFRLDPEDPVSDAPPSERGDEIGTAQRELLSMQAGLRMALKQKTRLAALGVGVTKISHDLRNVLTTAQLESDRLAKVKDPLVQRVLPILLRSIDRAVALCSQTLDYARTEEVPVRMRMLDLYVLVDEVAEHLAEETEIEPINGVPREFMALGDYNQLYRVLQNLGMNAAEAGAKTIQFDVRRDAGNTVLGVADDGPGMDERAIEHLFEPFAGSARPGGIGLGLAISREIVQAHGGDLALAASGAAGTRFEMILPGGTGQ